MKISQPSVSALASVITGDGKISKYRSGSDIVRFVNQFNWTFIDIGSSSRRAYAEGCLRDINNTKDLMQFFSAALDPREFWDTEFDPEKVCEFLNKYLEYDGYKIVKRGKGYIVVEIKENIVGLEFNPLDFRGMSFEFIEEQVGKAKNKIVHGDYSGAITNARSLLEGILIEIDYKFSGEEVKYDGDLVKLYRKVMKQMNLEPGRSDISETLKQILSGLISIVNGMASLRNKMSDAHASIYKPSEHHALLAVNAVNTLSSFLLASYNYQVDKNLIVKSSDEKDS